MLGRRRVAEVLGWRWGVAEVGREADVEERAVSPHGAGVAVAHGVVGVRMGMTRAMLVVEEGDAVAVDGAGFAVPGRQGDGWDASGGPGKEKE